jgi:hypothetical protein
MPACEALYFESNRSNLGIWPTGLSKFRSDVCCEILLSPESIQSWHLTNWTQQILQRCLLRNSSESTIDPILAFDQLDSANFAAMLPAKFSWVTRVRIRFKYCHHTKFEAAIDRTTWNIDSRSLCPIQQWLIRGYATSFTIGMNNKKQHSRSYVWSEPLCHHTKFETAIDRTTWNIDLRSLCPIQQWLIRGYATTFTIGMNNKNQHSKSHVGRSHTASVSIQSWHLTNWTQQISQRCLLRNSSESHGLRIDPWLAVVTSVT